MGMTGLPELYRHLDGVAAIPQTVSEAWADSAQAIARSIVPVKTGETRRSIRIVAADPTHARVEAGGAATFIEGGSRPHEITAHNKALTFRGSLTGGPVFAKRVHQQRIAPRPFMADAGSQALERLPLSQIAVEGWDKGR